MRVHIGSSFADSGKVLREKLQDRAFPLLVMDEKQIGIRAWSDRMSNQYVVVVLRGSESNITTEKATYVTLPARIGDILVAAGFDVSADDPRLSAVVSQDFTVGSERRSAPSPAPAPVSAPAPTTAPAPRVERAPARPAATDFDDLFDGVPEASVSDDFSEPQRDETEAWTPAPVPSHEPVPAPVYEPEPEPAPAPESIEPDWMSQTSAPVSVENTPAQDDDLPSWMKDSSPVAAESHRNSTGDGGIVPDDAGEYQPENHREGFEEVSPVFDPTPLDDSFDPDWEPDDAEVVDLSQEREYKPVPTAPFLPKPQSAPEVPSWMERASVPAPEPVVAPEPEPVVVPTPPIDGFEVIDTVDTFPDPTTPTAVSEDSRSLDDILAEISRADVVKPVPAPEPVPVVVARPEPVAPKKLCPIIVCFASKGGVGKSTWSLTLAQAAAEMNLRVTLIDGNRGQGGVRKFLRVNENVNSIYDAAVRNDPLAALAMPRDVNAARSSSLPPVSYAVVFAPPDALADPRVVTSRIYADVVEYARSVSDLVILDTQISERFDTTGIIESVAIPSIGGPGGFGLGITNDSSEGVRNLQERLEHFSSVGVTRDHLFTVVNNISYFDDSIIASFRNRYSPYSTFVGVVGADEDFKNRYNVGIIDTEGSTLTPAVRYVLRAATGDARFDPVQEPQKTRRFGFGRRK